MDQGRIRHLEEALRNINRQLDMLRLGRQIDPRITQGLEKQRLTIEEELANIKQQSAQKVFSIFGILDRFDEEETIELPKQPVRPQSNSNS